MEDSTRDEREWAKEFLVDLKGDQLQVKYITTDTDTVLTRLQNNSIWQM